MTIHLVLNDNAAMVLFFGLLFRSWPCGRLVTR
jgi:hypothetical protein